MQELIHSNPIGQNHDVFSKHNMALPTGNDPSDEDEYVSAQEEEKPYISSYEQSVLHRLLPPPEMPQLLQKVLLESHLAEVNALLEESGMLVGNSFVLGYANRCRTAIRNSFSGFPEIANQTRLWFSNGLSWEQIQIDLIRTFAGSREVTDSYVRALSTLRYGPDFPNACRDLFVVHQAALYRRPHLYVDFVQKVCEKLPPGIQKAVISKLSDEVDDIHWQEARPFWEPSSTHTVIHLIDQKMRSEMATARISKDKVLLTAEQPPPKPRQTWLDAWVASQPSVWRVESDKQTAIDKLRSKALEVKGPLTRNSARYFFMSFKDEATARGELGALLSPTEFRPFVRKNA